MRIEDVSQIPAETEVVSLATHFSSLGPHQKQGGPGTILPPHIG